MRHQRSQHPRDRRVQPAADPAGDRGHARAPRRRAATARDWRRSFADAEPRKDRAEQIVGGELAGDRRQRGCARRAVPRRRARAAAGAASRCSAAAARCALGVAQRDEMALAREERAFHVLVRARQREDFVLQEIDAGAGLRRQEHVPPRGAPFVVRAPRPAASVRRGRSCCGRRCAEAPRAARRESRHRPRPVAPPSRASTSTSARSAVRDGGPRALDAERFDRIVGGAQARGVDRSSAECRGSRSSRSTVSRVVPAIGVTIATSSPASRLRRLDLPTLGAPDQDDGEPVAQQRALPRPRRRPARAAPRIAASLPCASAARRKSMSSSGKSSVASVNIRSSISASTSARTSRENAPDRLRAAARAAVAVAASIRSATPFGLREVELAVQKRALREFARLARAARRARAAREHEAQHRGAAVPVQLEHRLAGVRMRRRKMQREALVERLAVARRETRRASARRGVERAPDDRPRSPPEPPAPDTRTTPMPPRPGRRGDRRRSCRRRGAMRRDYRTRRSAGPNVYRRFAAATAASLSSRRFMCHCWKIWMQLLTSQ